MEKVTPLLILRFASMFCCLLSPLLAVGQQLPDTTLSLPLFEVSTQRIEDFREGYRIESPDSSFRAQHRSSSLGDLLADHGDIFIKNYGPGSIATSAFRGGNASHTAVVWNGFNIQSATLGQTDFSIIPANSFDGIDIQYGGSTALWGSGAVGGSIHLNSKTAYNSGFCGSAGVESGSFEHRGYRACIRYGGKKYAGKIMFNHVQTENNYPFVNRARYGSPKDTMRHAAFSQRSLIQDHHVQLAKRHELSLHVWLSEHDRQIPPSMTQGLNQTATQEDITVRTGINYRYTGNKHTLYYRAAYFDEQLTYHNHQNDRVSPSQFNTIIQEVESKIELHQNHQLNVGVNFTHFDALTSGYPDRTQQWRMAGFAAYKMQSNNQRWKAMLSLRQETLEEDFQPITPSLGIVHQLTETVSLHGNVNRSYRLPTLNDMYWHPGGNPDLLPEQGWGQEFFMQWNIGDFSLNAGGYNRNMTNWIIWTPTNGIWSPQNIRQVDTHGAEIKLAYQRSIGAWTWKARINASYVLSLNAAPQNDNDNSVGKQLIYTPPLNASFFTVLTNKRFSVSYTHNYTDVRYTSTDNTNYLPVFHAANLRVSYMHRIKNIRAELFATANNIWNEQYEVMLWRAMPGRNYRIGLEVFF